MLPIQQDEDYDDHDYGDHECHAYNDNDDDADG